MQTSVIGFPRIGTLRELKFASEKYFKKEISEKELLQTGKELRVTHWNTQKQAGIDYISCNDFSYYDMVLDTVVLFNLIPKRYKELNLSDLDTYFAMARGYQGENGDVKALAMKKWFNTNYHYLVPEVDDQVEISLNGTKIFDEFQEALDLGIKTKPVIVGPYTLMKLLRFTGTLTYQDILDDLINGYLEVIKKLRDLGASWIEVDEPALVFDLSDKDIILFKEIYTKILDNKESVKILLQTYFGDIRDCYQTVLNLDFDGIGLDFIEGKENLTLLDRYGFDQNKILFAGVVNGKNIWKNEYEKTVSLIEKIKLYAASFPITTPFGTPVVPDVYKTYETSSSNKGDSSLQQ